LCSSSSHRPPILHEFSFLFVSPPCRPIDVRIRHRYL
jgi:hypothetical protein